MTTAGETSQSSESTARVWRLFSPDATALPSAAALSACASRHFDTAMIVRDATVDGSSSRFVAELLGVVVEARSLAVVDAADAIHAANRAVIAIGGAGFDALVPRTKRVWFIDAPVDSRAVLTVVAVMASTLLAPVVPLAGDAIFGVRGARERLDRLR